MPLESASILANLELLCCGSFRCFNKFCLLLLWTSCFDIVLNCLCFLGLSLLVLFPTGVRGCVLRAYSRESDVPPLVRFRRPLPIPPLWMHTIFACLCTSRVLLSVLGPFTAGLVT